MPEQDPHLLNILRLLIKSGVAKTKVLQDLIHNTNFIDRSDKITQGENCWSKWVQLQTLNPPKS